MNDICFEAYEWDFQEWDDDEIRMDLNGKSIYGKQGRCYICLTREDAKLMLKELKEVLGE